MLLRRCLAALGLAACATSAQAACDTGLAERMHAKLHPDLKLDHALAVCRPWRGVPGRFIVVLPLPHPGSEPGITQYDLDLLVVQMADNGNTDHDVITERLLQRDALTQDETRIEDIRVDAARYVLAKDARAFGLRVLSQDHSRAAPFARETLSLYLPHGRTLRPVLEGLEVSHDQGTWDTNCVGEFETLRGSLSVEHDSSSDGYADLLLHETLTRTHTSLQDQECVTREQPARFRTRTLRFNGTLYQPVKAGRSP